MSLQQAQIAAIDVFVPQSKSERADERPSDGLFAHELSQQSAKQTKTPEPRVSDRSVADANVDRGGIDVNTDRRRIEENRIVTAATDNESESGGRAILSAGQVSMVQIVPDEYQLNSPAITQPESAVSVNPTLAETLVLLGETGGVLQSVEDARTVKLTDAAATQKSAAAALENYTIHLLRNRAAQVGGSETVREQGLIPPEQTKGAAQIQNGALRPSVLSEAVDLNQLSRGWAQAGEQSTDVLARDTRLIDAVILNAEVTTAETTDTKQLLQALNSSSQRVAALLKSQRNSTQQVDPEGEFGARADVTDTERGSALSAKTGPQSPAANGAATQRNALAAANSLLAQNGGGEFDGESGAHDPNANGAGEFLRTLNSASVHGRTDRAAAPNQIAQLEIPKEIAQFASGQVKTLTLKISPASLGEAKLSVSLVRDRIHGSLVVESHAAKSAIEGQLHRLAERLASEGLTLDSLDVEVGADQWSEERASQWRDRAGSPNARFSLEDIEQEISGGAVVPEQGRAGARNVVSAAGVDALV